MSQNMRGFAALKGQGANPRVFCLVMEIAFFQESGVKRCPKRQLSLLLFQYVPQRKRNPTAARMEKVTIAGVNPYRPIFRMADSSPLTLHSFAMAPARMMALARNLPRSIMEPRSTFFLIFFQIGIFTCGPFPAIGTICMATLRKRFSCANCSENLPARQA